MNESFAKKKVNPVGTNWIIILSHSRRETHEEFSKIDKVIKKLLLLIRSKKEFPTFVQFYVFRQISPWILSIPCICQWKKSVVSFNGWCGCRYFYTCGINCGSLCILDPLQRTSPFISNHELQPHYDFRRLLFHDYRIFYAYARCYVHHFEKFVLLRCPDARITKGVSERRYFAFEIHDFSALVDDGWTSRSLRNAPSQFSVFQMNQEKRDFSNSDISIIEINRIRKIPDT